MNYQEWEREFNRILIACLDDDICTTVEDTSDFMRLSADEVRVLAEAWASSGSELERFADGAQDVDNRKALEEINWLIESVAMDDSDHYPRGTANALSRAQTYFESLKGK